MLFKENFKNKVLNAIGEIVMIVVGILLAMYIDNWNADVQNKKTIDSSFQKVYLELETNIKEAKINTEQLYLKDSLIYLVMNNAVKSEDYANNFGLSYLIINYHNLIIDDKAYQNLIKLDISDENYKKDLLSRLKDLNTINETIKTNNDRMSAFVYEETLPLLARNTTTFGDLTYKGQINKDVVDYFITSQEYKSYVSQYAIIALKNQLRYYQIYLRTALKVYQDIGKVYNLETNKAIQVKYASSKLQGTFYNEQLRDTLQVKASNDSLFIIRKDKQKTNLINIAKNLFISSNEEGRFFISFVSDEKSKLGNEIKMTFLSNHFSYIKQK